MAKKHFSTNTPQKKTRKLNRVVIKEEFVELLGHPIKALMLNQFLYWEERHRDFDRFIEEEKARDPETPQSELTEGWIYKSADQLRNELMLDKWISRQTMQRYLKDIVDLGYLESRRNPDPNKQWDRTLQYRPNILKIQTDLMKVGYTLEGYSFNPKSLIFPKAHNELSSAHNELLNAHSELSSAYSEQTIPKTITETTSKNTTKTSAGGDCEKNRPRASSSELDFSNLNMTATEEEEAIELLAETPHPDAILEATRKAVNSGKIKHTPMVYIKGLIKKDKMGSFRVNGKNEKTERVPVETTSLSPEKLAENRARITAMIGNGITKKIGENGIEPTPPRPTFTPPPNPPVAHRAPASRPAIKVNIEPEYPEDEWTEIVKLLNIDAFVRELARHCRMLRKDDDVWTLKLPIEHRLLFTRDRQLKLESELCEHLGREIELEIRMLEMEEFER